MNRRSFLRSLAISTAFLVTRFRPVEMPSINADWADGEYEVGFIMARSSFERLAPVAFDGHSFTPCIPPARFTVKNGIVIHERQ